MTWTDLQRAIKAGEPIRYWGAYSGYSYGIFTISELNEKKLRLIIPSGEKVTVYRRDFEKIAPLYDEYVDGTLPSADIKRRTGRSAYIFSLVHELRDRALQPA